MCFNTDEQTDNAAWKTLKTLTLCKYLQGYT